jgi:hypothetical protein
MRHMLEADRFLIALRNLLNASDMIPGANIGAASQVKGRRKLGR